MSDWAMEEAVKIWPQTYVTTIEDAVKLEDRIVSALRKAKANGVREIIPLLEPDPKCNCRDCQKTPKFIEYLNDLAARIEKGE